MLQSPAPATPAAPDVRAEAADLVTGFRDIDWLQLLESWGLKLLAAAVIVAAVARKIDVTP